MCDPVDQPSPGCKEVIDDEEGNQTTIQSRTAILVINSLLSSCHGWGRGHGCRGKLLKKRGLYEVNTTCSPDQNHAYIYRFI
jgi:hypothetical protein